MRRYGYNAHSKYDMKVHLVWIPKYRKRVLIGQIGVRVRELLRQVTMENEIQIISGKVAVDHIHMFISYKPQQSVSKIVQLLKGTSSRLLMQDFASLRKHFWAGTFGHVDI
uniref:IS200/IS605 family transposase n=1 Tax=Wolbachia endosymbiont of Laodelphax striatellus TaxID=368602 RepID=UPI002103AC8E|nr:IS200/IS605 family transposase [Wolbachia endosymbiont of Laodelphax striatellus]